jgi:protein-S-isoprenylcysteine O-methyltransferase Ste14
MPDSIPAAARQAAAAESRPGVRSWRRISTALAWGLACHGLFALAIPALAIALHDGWSGRAPRLQGAAAVLANAVLVLQFPVLHSFLLARRGKGTLARLAPFGLGRDLAPTTFGIVASLQILAVVALWSPSGVVLFEARGVLRALFEILFAASWIFLMRALWDAGIALQTGFIGWSAVLRGRKPAFKPFPRHGLFATCRQPVYLAFATTLWTGPVLTLDRLALALAWTAYCVLGPLLKERRYLARHGASYSAYQRQVPYLFPSRAVRPEVP